MLVFYCMIFNTQKISLSIVLCCFGIEGMYNYHNMLHEWFLDKVLLSNRFCNTLYFFLSAIPGWKIFRDPQRENLRVFEICGSVFEMPIAQQHNILCGSKLDISFTDSLTQ